MSGTEASIRFGPLEWTAGTWDGPGNVTRHEAVGALAMGEIDRLPTSPGEGLWVDRSAGERRLIVDADNGSWVYRIVLETVQDVRVPYERYRLELIH